MVDVPGGELPELGQGRRTRRGEAWRGLADEARALAAFLADRQPQVYRRYDRWWTTLPSAEVRVLPG